MCGLNCSLNYYRISLMYRIYIYKYICKNYTDQRIDKLINTFSWKIHETNLTFIIIINRMSLD